MTTDKDVAKSASATILKYRKLEGLSQVQVAGLLDVSQPLVSSWECGRVMPSIKDVRRLEELFNTEPGEMFYQIAYPQQFANPNSELIK